jgi:hypothetical protein
MTMEADEFPPVLLPSPDVEILPTSECGDGVLRDRVRTRRPLASALFAGEKADRPGLKSPDLALDEAELRTTFLSMQSHLLLLGVVVLFLPS